MHDARLMDLLAEVLATHGYTCTRQAALEGRSGTVYTVPLLAEADERALIVDAQMSDDVVPLGAIADMADVLHDVGADSAVLCHRGAIESGDRQDGVLLWNQDHLIQIIGEAQLAAVLDETPSPLVLERRSTPGTGPMAESLHELLPSAFLDGISGDADAALEVPAEETIELVSPFDLVAMESMDLGGLGDMTPPLDRTLADEPVETSAFSHPLLPIRLTPDEARLHLRGRMERIEAVQMVLQPVHILDYECDLLVEGSLRYDTVNGRIQVHGTDKVAIEVDREAIDPQGFTRLAELPALPHHERTLRTSAERAKERATAFLLEAHTRMVDVEVDEPDSGFSYTEKKKVSPRPDHIRLAPLGVFHRVLWRFTGPAGQIDIDSMTGTVAEQLLTHPDDGAMIID